MANKDKIITIFGGTGFLGRHVVRNLAKEGYKIKIITRNPAKAYFLKPYGDIGQIVASKLTSTASKDIADIIKGSYAVINTIGILFEKGKSTFENIHIDLVKNIATACTQEKIHKFIHISALGIETSSSKYAKTKLTAEQVIKEIYPNVTLIRPSVIFGKEDNFFNKFAKMPFLPLIGGGKTKFQPVYVGDVAKAVTTTIKRPLESKIFELAGPETLSLKEVYQRISLFTSKKITAIPLPFFMAKIIGFFAGVLPIPPLTLDQVTSLQYDNVLSNNNPTFTDLDIEPKPLNIILPTYLYRYTYQGSDDNSEINEDLI